MVCNGLQLNASKTKCMLLHSSRRRIETGLDVHVDGVTVDQIRLFKYLGVLINDTLTWSDHVDMICRKVSCSLNLLCRLA